MGVEPVAGDGTQPETAVGDGPEPAEQERAWVARRRRRQVTARPHAVFVRLSGEEFEVVAVAAARAGVTPTSYVASTAVAVARGEVRPLPADTGAVVRELVEARTLLRRYATLLNQAVAKLNATGEVDGALTAALGRCEAAVAGVHGAVARLGRPVPQQTSRQTQRRGSGRGSGS